MALKITILPSGRAYEADPQASILQSALDAGISLPYGCRNGACGSCKGRVLFGSVDYGAYQTGALSDVERESGLALFCCARPLSDITIECREVSALKDIPVRTLPCRVQKMERRAADVMVLYLKLPANERLQFLAGQYIDILLKDGRRRSFSLANAPHDDDLLQLHVRHVPGGQFTDHVFHTMKERDILRFEGPHGAFHLREGSNKPIVLVAGGTGLAPIKAVIDHAIHNRIELPMALYWGVRSLADLYMPGLAEAWQARRPDFRFVPVLSEPKDEDCWHGRIGLVHRAAMEDLPDLSGHQAYVCGVPAMVEAAKRDFTTQCGLPPEEFFADAFSFAADVMPAS